MSIFQNFGVDFSNAPFGASFGDEKNSQIPGGEKKIITPNQSPAQIISNQINSNISHLNQENQVQDSILNQEKNISSQNEALKSLENGENQIENPTISQTPERVVLKLEKEIKPETKKVDFTNFNLNIEYGPNDKKNEEKVLEKNIELKPIFKDQIQELPKENILEKNNIELNKAQNQNNILPNQNISNNILENLTGEKKDFGNLSENQIYQDQFLQNQILQNNSQEKNILSKNKKNEEEKDFSFEENKNDISLIENAINQNLKILPKEKNNQENILENGENLSPNENQNKNQNFALDSGISGVFSGNKNFDINNFLKNLIDENIFSVFIDEKNFSKKDSNQILSIEKIEKSFFESIKNSLERLNPGISEKLINQKFVNFILKKFGFKIFFNVFYSFQKLSITINFFKDAIEDFDYIGVPEQIKQLLSRNFGVFFLFSDSFEKNTFFMHSIIDFFSKNEKKYIISLEGKTQKKIQTQNSFISQRIFGEDFTDFSGTIDFIKLENPDIVFISKFDEKIFEKTISLIEEGKKVFFMLNSNSISNSFEIIFSLMSKNTDFKEILFIFLSGIIFTKSIFVGQKEIFSFESFFGNENSLDLIKNQDIEKLKLLFNSKQNNSIFSFYDYIDFISQNKNFSQFEINLIIKKFFRV